MTKMSILQISNAFLGTKVHRNLAISLDRLGVNQHIFTVIRQYKQPNRSNLVDFRNEDSSIVFSRTLRLYHRLFFRLKSKQLYHDLTEQIEVKDVDITHATTLLTDGYLAYKLFVSHNIPYVVTIRSVDLDHFFKYRPDLMGIAYKVLNNAKRLVFVSPSLMSRFFIHKSIAKKGKAWKQKAVLSKNGIDDFWLDNAVRTKKTIQLPTKLLFIGRLVMRKNLLRLANAIDYLRNEYPNLSLTIVGAKGPDDQKIKQQLEVFSDFVSFIEPTTDKNELLKIYREHDLFLMPSYYETFGLVYIEAMSQGLPVLYTLNDGIDGVFTEKVGVGVNPFQLDSIISGIRRLINQHQIFEVGHVDYTKFRWHNIANEYIELYEEVISNKFIGTKNSGCP